MVRIRPAIVDDALAIATVQVKAWRATYPGILPDEIIDGLTVESRCRAWDRALRRETRWVPWVSVAEIDQEIVGFASGGMIRHSLQHFDAELYAIYLLPDAQGRGVGRQLVGEISRTLVTQRFRAMIVQVLARNPACQFYERLGASLLNEDPLTIEGREFPGRCYGWANLDHLGQGIG